MTEEMQNNNKIIKICFKRFLNSRITRLLLVLKSIFSLNKTEIIFTKGEMNQMSYSDLMIFITSPAEEFKNSGEYLQNIGYKIAKSGFIFVKSACSVFDERYVFYFHSELLEFKEDEIRKLIDKDHIKDFERILDLYKKKKIKPPERCSMNIGFRGEFHSIFSYIYYYYKKLKYERSRKRHADSNSLLL